ncbi:MAG: hypothetical protein ACXWQO_19860 [Bdellovibrionota bacterium]
MKTFLFAVSLIAAGASAQAAEIGYECFAKANPNRDFSSDMTVDAQPAKVGGQMLVKVKGVEKKLGTFSEDSWLVRSNPAHKEAFEQVLGYLNEEDVSGIAAKDLNNVAEINALRVVLPGDDEAYIYRLFDDKTQIGGSVIISGSGTACIPK